MADETGTRKRPPTLGAANENDTIGFSRASTSLNELMFKQEKSSISHSADSVPVEFLNSAQKELPRKERGDGTMKELVRSPGRRDSQKLLAENSIDRMLERELVRSPPKRDSMKLLSENSFDKSMDKAELMRSPGRRDSMKLISENSADSKTISKAVSEIKPVPIEEKGSSYQSQTVAVRAKPPRSNILEIPTPKQHRRAASDVARSPSKDGSSSPRGGSPRPGSPRGGSPRGGSGRSSPRRSRKIENTGPLQQDMKQQELVGQSISASPPSFSKQRNSYRKSVAPSDHYGPLNHDTKQQELIEQSMAAKAAASGGGSMGRKGASSLDVSSESTFGKGSLFPTLRGRTGRQSRRIDSDSSIDEPSLGASGESMDLGGKKRLTSIFQRSGGNSQQQQQVDALNRQGSSESSFSEHSNSNLNDLKEPPASHRGGGISAIGSSGFGGTTGTSVAGGAGGGGAGAGGKKRVGFFQKLRQGLQKKSEPVSEGTSPKESLAKTKSRFKFSSPDLEAREAQLAAAGFSELPGTLLSRAKGAELDEKFKLKWNQFELKKEIGEGAYAMVYLATVTTNSGSKIDVAVKELKLIGNERNDDMRLEVAAVVDAINDCGFPTVAEVVKVASEMLRDPETFQEAREAIRQSLDDFRACISLEDEACVQIVSVLESLVALPAPPKEPVEEEKEGASQRLMKDIKQEVEVLSGLWHKNIVEFVGTCFELPHLAIAMQYANKGPLSEILINENVVLGWDLRVKWAKETAEAIHYLHNLVPKIIHRDLKADNILIDENNTAIVTDFGLSKAKVLTMMNPAGAPTLAGRQAGPSHIAKYKSFVEFSEVAGTPSYLAPELWRNESYSEAVDVYSFGVVLWELLARDAPYRDLSNEDLVFALRDNQMRPPIPNWTPEAYRLLTERCWSELPSTRPNFDQVVKLLKILEEKHIFQWIPPDNYSLDEEAQHRYILSWKMEKESKDLAILAAEKKLKAAQHELKVAKNSEGHRTALLHLSGEQPLK